MDINSKNKKRKEPSEFFDNLEQNNNNDENFFYKEKNYINKQMQKEMSQLKYNIEVNIPQKVKYNKNTFIKAKNKKDNFIRNTEDSNDLVNNKQNGIKLNYEINDYFVKGFKEKKERKNKSKNKKRNKSNKKEFKKFNKSNSTLNNLEYKNKNNNAFDSQKFKSNQNLGLHLTLKTSTELNEINKNKLIFSSSLNNLKELKEFTNKTTNNITSNFSQTINTHNISIKLPFEETMKNEILDILNLNNNIKINQNDFNTIQNITHSNSTKSYSFSRRKKPFVKSKNYLTDEIIDNILQSSNEFNRKEDENKIIKLEKEIEKIKEEYNKIKEEKNNLETSNMIMQNEMRYFYRQKELEKDNFEKYKQIEIKKLIDEKNRIEKENITLKELKKKYQNKNLLNNNNDDDLINIDKDLVETYKIKLDRANEEVTKLKNILKNLNINYNKEYNKDIQSISNKNKNIKIIEDNNETDNLSDDCDESEDNDDDNYDLILPDIYHKTNYNLIKTEKNNEGSLIKIYDKNKIEINLINGDKKEIYDDKYEIIYYFNGDIKQIFKDKNKQVFFFKKQNITKTTLNKGLQIIKYNDNNQIEKIFSNGTKKISSADGRLKYILPNGLQETYFSDGRVERKLKDGNTILECGEGIKG